MNRQTLARWSDRHPDASDLTVGVGVGLVVFAGTVIQRGPGPDALLAAASLGLGIGALAVWSLRRRRDRAGRAAAQMLEQRLVIARELHDVVAHHVSLIGIEAAAARRTLGRSPAETAVALGAIEASSRAAVIEMQNLVTTLREPDIAGDRAAGTTPAPTLADLPALSERMRAADLTVELAGFDDPVVRDLPAAAQLALYRVVQEALTNALRHAGPVTVLVSCRIDGGDVVVTVEHGPGRARPGSPTGTGLGIPGMNERMRAVGGSLEAGPNARGGFSVIARAPLPAAPTGASHAGVA